MTEKIGLIKNPLTVIAIFAGIAEVSGTVVLPFIAEKNQMAFIYFLIVFPSVLVVLFFITLNFNNKALYAPSDFNNEENYIKIFKYDLSKRENIEVKVSQEELLKMLNNNITEFKNLQESRFLKIENDLKESKSKLNNSEKVEIAKIVEDEDDDYDYEEEDYDEFFEDERPDLISITSFPKVNQLVRRFSIKGYIVEIYDDKKATQLHAHKSIWLGYKFPFEIAKDAILQAKSSYPHLTYIELSNYKSKPPLYVHSQLFIGGSTSTAKERGTKPILSKDWERFSKLANIKELHEFVKEFQA